MPRVIGKVEGKGNGIKTVIFNVTDLSMALKREPGEVCKFFGTELGAQVSPRDLVLTEGAGSSTAPRQSHIFFWLGILLLIDGDY